MSPNTVSHVSGLYNERGEGQGEGVPQRDRCQSPSAISSTHLSVRERAGGETPSPCLSPVVAGERGYGDHFFTASLARIP